MALNFLDRGKKKKLALFLIGAGIVFASPPGLVFGETFTDIFLNVPVAIFLVKHLGVGLLTGLIITYTVIPAILIYTGAYVYPHNTNNILNGLWTKTKKYTRWYIRKLREKPIYLLWIFIIFYIIFIIINWLTLRIAIWKII